MGNITFEIQNSTRDTVTIKSVSNVYQDDWNDRSIYQWGGWTLSPHSTGNKNINIKEKTGDTNFTLNMTFTDVRNQQRNDTMQISINTTGRSVNVTNDNLFYNAKTLIDMETRKIILKIKDNFNKYDNMLIRVKQYINRHLYHEAIEKIDKYRKNRLPGEVNEKLIKYKTETHLKFAVKLYDDSWSSNDTETIINRLSMAKIHLQEAKDLNSLRPNLADKIHRKQMAELSVKDGLYNLNEGHNYVITKQYDLAYEKYETAQEDFMTARDFSVKGEELDMRFTALAQKVEQLQKTLDDSMKKI